MTIRACGRTRSNAEDHQSNQPLLPGKTHRTTIAIDADNDQYCEAPPKYRVAYVQRQYPNL
jgi:hypothetical protein